MESARYIHESALRLHRLIENFLVYSQLELMASESKKIETVSSVTAVSPDALLPEVARKVAVRFRREADLQMSLCQAQLLIPAENLQKIVEELVDNAFKFSEPGTPVELRAELVSGAFRLSVRDRGRGMSVEQIAKVAPHIQFDRKTFEQQGAGLGLAIAKRMTELLDGQFVIESLPGKETTVVVIFPQPVC